MKLYRKLGLPDGSVDPGFYLNGLKRMQSVPDRDDTREQNKWFVALEYHHLASAYYLNDDREQARHWAGMVGPAMCDYFHGDWQRTTPRAGALQDSVWWKRRLMWMHEFQVGWLWSMSVGDWASVRRLAEYPDEDCLHSLRASAGSDPASRAALYLAIASFLRGDREAAHSWLERGVADSRWYGPLGESLAGVSAGDRAGASKSLVESVRRHRARSRKPRQIDMAFDMDSSILYHLLCREGVVPEIPDNLAHYLIRF